MEKPFAAAGPARHPERAAPDIDPVQGLAPVAEPVAMGHFPCRIIGRRAQHPHLMAARRQPDAHFAGIFADTDGLRRIIQAIDEKLHLRSPGDGGCVMALILKTISGFFRFRPGPE